MLSGASGDAVQAMPESDDAQAQSEEVSDISDTDLENRMDIYRPLVCHGRGGSRVMGGTRVPEALQMAVFDVVNRLRFLPVESVVEICQRCMQREFKISQPLENIKTLTAWIFNSTTHMVNNIWTHIKSKRQPQVWIQTLTSLMSTTSSKDKVCIANGQETTDFDIVYCAEQLCHLLWMAGLSVSSQPRCFA